MTDLDALRRISPEKVASGDHQAYVVLAKAWPGILIDLERAERIEIAARRWLDNEDRRHYAAVLHLAAGQRDTAKARLRKILADEKET